MCRYQRLPRESGQLQTHIRTTPTVREPTACRYGGDFIATMRLDWSSSRPKPCPTRTSSRGAGCCHPCSADAALTCLNEQTGEIDLVTGQVGDAGILHHLDFGVLAVHGRTEEAQATAFQVHDPDFRHI